MSHIKEQHYHVEVVEVRKKYLFPEGLLAVKFSLLYFLEVFQGKINFTRKRLTLNLTFYLVSEPKMWSKVFSMISLRDQLSATFLVNEVQT